MSAVTHRNRILRRGEKLTERNIASFSSLQPSIFMHTLAIIVHWHCFLFDSVQWHLKQTATAAREFNRKMALTQPDIKLFQAYVICMHYEMKALINE